MPGFGSGPFGQGYFGEWPWARATLFETLPDEVRKADEEAGGYHEKWTEALGSCFDEVRRKIEDLPLLRDPEYVRTQFDDVRLVRLGVVVPPARVVEQRGVDGRVNTFREFESAVARFSVADEGKELAVAKSSVASNNRTVRIARFVSVHSVLTDPPLEIDAGKDRWQLRVPSQAREGIVTLKIREGDLSGVRPGHLLTDGFAQYEVKAVRFFEKGATRLTQREGSDGQIDSLGRFSSPSLGAEPDDVGKRLFIQGRAPLPAWYPIVECLASSLVVVGGPVLEMDLGPLRWAMLPFPEIDVEAKVPSLGVVEQRERDLTIVAPGQFASPSLQLTQGDVGKILTVYGTHANNRRQAQILSVSSATSGSLDVSEGSFVSETSMAWEIRSKTDKGDGTQVEIYAPSILQHLAADFGLTVDSSETARRQRAWVQNCREWRQKKGAAEAYRIVGLLCGFQVEASKLYRISLDISRDIAPDHLVLTIHPGAGKTGSSGSFGAGPLVVFSDPAARFRPSDEDSVLRVSGSSSGNDGFYEITSYLSSTSVSLRAQDTSSLIVEDSNNGALRWDLVRCYTDLVPKRPRFDEINIDLMNEISSFAIQAANGIYLQNGDFFTIDDGSLAQSFEFTTTGTVSPGRTAVIYTSGDTASVVAAAIVSAVNASSLQVRAFSRSGGTAVSLARVSARSPRILVQEQVVASQFTVRSPVQFFAPDHLCTEEGMSTEIQVFAVNISSVVFVHTVDVIATLRYPDAPEAVLAVGSWFFVDSSGRQHFLDQVPNLVGTDGVTGLPLYRFTVTATIAPVVSRQVAGVLDYLCPEIISCDFCGSSKIRVRITEGSIVNDPPFSRAQAHRRVRERLQQVAPLDTELIFTSVAQATGSATGQADVDGSSV